MTKKELEQIYSINREIKMWQNALRDVKEQSIVKTNCISNMPGGGSNYSMVEKIAIQIEEIENKISHLLVRLYKQQQFILDFIDSIEDSTMRQIVFLRCVSMLSWNTVADEVGGGNTEDSVRMRYNRFFK